MKRLIQDRLRRRFIGANDDLRINNVQVCKVNFLKPSFRWYFLYLANLGRLSASLEFHRAIFIFLHLHRPTVKFAKSARRNMAQSVGRKFSIDPCRCFEVRALRQHCGYQPPKPSFADDVHVFPVLDSVPWLPIRSRRTIENPKP